MDSCSGADVEVFVGVDVAKGDHYACAVGADGAELFARGVPNDEAAIGGLIDDAAAHGAVGLVIDTAGSAAALLIETAARRQVRVAYVSGLAMRRAADLYAGAAKTDPKDAFVLADYAARNADRLSWVCVASDFARQVLSFFEQHRSGLAVSDEEAADVGFAGAETEEDAHSRAEVRLVGEDAVWADHPGRRRCGSGCGSLGDLSSAGGGTRRRDRGVGDVEARAASSESGRGRGGRGV